MVYITQKKRDLRFQSYKIISTGLFSPVGNTKTQSLKQLPEPASSRSQDDSASSSSMTGKGTKHSQDDDLSPPVQHSGSSDVSPDYMVGKILLGKVL